MSRPRPNPLTDAAKSPPRPQPHVTVFTITYNQRDKALRLIDDLAAQTYPATRFELVVLDDGGADHTTEAVQQAAAEVGYQITALRLQHEADYMSARRWNQCIAAASAESTVFIQVDDVRVRPDFLTQHVKWHMGPEWIVVTGAKFEGETLTWDVATCRRTHLAGPDGGARTFTAWTAVWGASLSYPRALVDAIWKEPHDRPFDERMVGWGFHEVEFACRAARAGAVLVYDRAAGVFHQNHSLRNDVGRGIDHARAIQAAVDRNARYVRDKHRLADLPRW
jgi:glycosyltransferase involved in cell wall biosynthesis